MNATATAQATAQADSRQADAAFSKVLQDKTEAPAETSLWAVDTDTGLTLMVPPSLRSTSTFVLLEQERWLLPEMSLLPHLLAGGVHALDIGAHLGAVALEMARCSGTGKVWAFEPTLVPRRALVKSALVNGMSQRLTAVGLALGDTAGEADFDVFDSGERNARRASGSAAPVGGSTERVQLSTLDAALKVLGVDVPVGFVMLDTAMDATRILAGATQFFVSQSPVVMFAFAQAPQVHQPLLQALRGLGFDFFRWSAELEIMLPFDPEVAERTLVTHLLAVRPAQQAQWAARGLLLTAQALIDEALPVLPGDEVGYARALAQVQAAHSRDAGLTPAQCVVLLIQARNELLALTAQGGDLPAWLLLAHCMHALGEPLAALRVASELLAQVPAEGWALADAERACPVLRAQHHTPCSTARGPWLRQMLAEYVATRSALSSCLEAPAPQRWAELLDHPDHSAEVERRYLLSHVQSDRVAPVAGLNKLSRLQQLNPTADRNATLWLGLLKSMRAMGQAASPVATPLQVLQDLPVGPVSVVDVGASALSTSITPYDSLLQAGRCNVIGFEPCPKALAELQQQHVGSPTRRYFPHVVGNGQPARFHSTEWSLTGSLLPPNRPVLDRYHDLGAYTVETGCNTVNTVRLDDLLPAGGMDLLKIDVQGAELQVFEGARQRLDECLMVWTEVSFLPLYRGQPLFAEVDQHLRRHGLQFQCFYSLSQRALASWPQQTAPVPPGQQHLWGDALYVPTPERVQALSVDSAQRLALLAHHVAKAWDLCHAALQRVDQLAGTDRAARYLAASQRAVRP